MKTILKTKNQSKNLQANDTPTVVKETLLLMIIKIEMIILMCFSITLVFENNRQLGIDF